MKEIKKERVKQHDILNSFENKEYLTNGLFLNYQFEFQSNYESYCIIKDCKGYKIKEIVKDFSPTVYYFINKKPSVRALEYFLSNINNNHKEELTYNDISRNIEAQEEELEKNNIVEKKFKINEANYRICVKNNYIHYYTIDTTEEIIGAIYYHTEQDVNKVIEKLNSYIFY